jgi:hypothetical protein
LKQFAEKASAERHSAHLPPYTCTVELQGPLAMKQELSSPFQIASNRDWSDTYVVLRGTLLSLYRLKSPGAFSKSKGIGPGRLIRHFTLQHAEIGLAADFKKTGPVPKSPFAHLMPAGARMKLYETDPHLFESPREHVIRLRLETEQILLCAASQEEVLDWIEALCSALDISPPLEDRSEPRYRSLPRRNRRQRLLDGAQAADLDNILSFQGGRSIVAEQERIIRRLYPHLAGADSSETPEATVQAPASHSSGDPERDDLDPEDVRFPAARRTASHNSESEERPSTSATSDSSADPKYRQPHSQSPSQALRYRRRCAPVLLADSPRVSDIVFSAGKRMRINIKEQILVKLTSLPPRYDVHNFPKKKKQPLSPVDESAPAKAGPAVIVTERPSPPSRAVSDDSIMSFGYDLASTSSEQNMSASDSDDIRLSPTSEPPSPTLAIRSKSDATRKLVPSKGRTSEERTRDDSLNVSLTMGLMI